VQRVEFLAEIMRAFRVHPVAALLGPRQSGKTTLARQFADRERRSGRVVHYFDLEDSEDLARLDHPQLALEPLRGTIIIDEVQHHPDLFKTLRVLVDRTLPAKEKPRFLVLGSASWNMLRQTSETLAGRIQFLELTPLSLREAGLNHLNSLWIRGGFPKSFLARSDSQSALWRKSYTKTYLEKDVPSLGMKIPPATLRRFWMMLAHYHGQIFNASEIGRSLGLTDHTVRHYLDILAGTFMVRELTPWFENIGKRQVRAPKLFFRDSGIFHSLLGVSTFDELHRHPKVGASWEGFALEEVIRHHRADPEDVYFWATHNQAELDLLIVKDGKRLGYEVKYTDSPKVTPSMKIAISDLKLDSLRVVYPGKLRFPMAPTMEAVGLQTLFDAK